jgi:hypothetical protein
MAMDEAVVEALKAELEASIAAVSAFNQVVCDVATKLGCNAAGGVGAVRNGSRCEKGIEMSRTWDWRGLDDPSLNDYKQHGEKAGDPIFVCLIDMEYSYIVAVYRNGRFIEYILGEDYDFSKDRPVNFNCEWVYWTPIMPPILK